MSTTATRERPILFRPELVRKILGGKKTQTRRPVKPQPDDVKPLGHRGSLVPYRYAEDIKDMPGVRLQRPIDCPFGQVGDVLWVRETWLELDREGYRDLRKPRDAMIDFVTYPVRNGVAYLADSFDDSDSDRCRRELGYKWSPSIHMPHWACRLRLEITDVRVERVQDISHRDALAEGVDYDVSEVRGAPIRRFHSAWNAAYPGSWDRNDWVWAITFKALA